MLFRSEIAASKDMEGMVAAHKHLPIGSLVRVKHGSKSVVLMITDRGPFSKGFILDISKKAASRLGILEQGVMKFTTIEVVAYK